MKKSSKIISALLAVLMLMSLIPGAALADSVDTYEAETAALLGENSSIGDILSGLKDLEIPTLAVYCKLSNNLPASNAQITLTNQLNGETKTYTADKFGIALIPKSLLSLYTIAATCDGSITGLKYSTIPGQSLSTSALPDLQILVLYPIMNVGLNYTDHFSYMVGYEDGTVRPNGSITRGAIASMLFRLLDNDTRDKIYTKTNSFSDVDASCAHNNAISSLASCGIINGYADGTYRPYEPVTRAQFATLVGRMFSVEYIGKDLFGDINSSFANKYLNLLAKLGIMKGDANGNANPNDLLTRGQAATMLNRLLGRLPAVDSADSCTGIVKTWSDCPRTMWCYGEIMEATNSHKYTWALDVPNLFNDDTAICEEWTSIRTDTPDWIGLSK